MNARRDRPEPVFTTPTADQDQRDQQETGVQPRQPRGRETGSRCSHPTRVVRLEPQVCRDEDDREESDGFRIDLEGEGGRGERQHGDRRPHQAQQLGTERVTQQAEESHRAEPVEKQQRHVTQDHLRREFPGGRWRQRQYVAVQVVAGKDERRHPRQIDLVEITTLAFDESLEPLAAIPLKSTRIAGERTEVAEKCARLFAHAPEESRHVAEDVRFAVERKVAEEAAVRDVQAFTLIPTFCVADVLWLITMQSRIEAQVARRGGRAQHDTDEQEAVQEQEPCGR